MRLLALIAVLLALWPSSRALSEADEGLEQVGFERIESVFDGEYRSEVRRIARLAMAGELGIEDVDPERALRALACDVKAALLRTLEALAPPALALLLMKLLMDGQPSALALLCRLACARALLMGEAEAFAGAREAVNAAMNVLEKASPVLSAALTLAGEEKTAATLSPLSALCAGAVERAATGLGLPLCGLASLIAAVGTLSDRFRMDRLFDLIKRAVVRGAVLTTAAFAGLLALQGRLSAPQDSVAGRLLYQALKGAVPIIGGELSGSAGALAASASAVRNAVGITGMLAVVCACAGPIVRLLVHMLSVKLAAALIEPVADPGISRLCDHFGDVSEMLLAICAGVMLPVMLLAGTCLGMFSGP